mmetsp:Transcript_2044/g.3056  ORF Transcript_2044/g.3056 Transcript_2044/m.3056 type:complete len:85 (-) Transcript_2044:103-357(-)
MNSSSSISFINLFEVRINRFPGNGLSAFTWFIPAAGPFRAKFVLEVPAIAGNRAGLEDSSFKENGSGLSVALNRHPGWNQTLLP